MSNFQTMCINKICVPSLLTADFFKGATSPNYHFLFTSSDFSIKAIAAAVELLSGVDDAMLLKGQSKSGAALYKAKNVIKMREYAKVT